MNRVSAGEFASAAARIGRYGPVRKGSCEAQVIADSTGARAQRRRLLLNLARLDVQNQEAVGFEAGALNGLDPEAWRRRRLRAQRNPVAAASWARKSIGQL
jgi:hypothetical protein